ncbi:hypothetical protein Droror1_Dr00027964 [Drosera rotundifolia]
MWTPKQKWILCKTSALPLFFLQRARRITSLPPHFLSSSPQQRQQDLDGAAKAPAVALGGTVKTEALAVDGAVKTAANLSGGVLSFKRRPDWLFRG